MRVLLIAVVTFGLGAGATSAQTGKASSRPAGKVAHDAAVADCLQMWDAGTHMTKQEWSRTCARVQHRLENLDLGSLVPAGPPGRPATN